MKTNKSNFPKEISKQFSLENASFRRSTFKQALVPLKTSTRKYKEKQISYSNFFFYIYISDIQRTSFTKYRLDYVFFNI